MQDFSERIAEIKASSPLDLPSKLEDIELHDKESAFELYDRISAQLNKEDLIENVVDPFILVVVDSILDLPCFKGITGRMGLSAQRVLNECKEFNYDDRLSFLMPDSQIESHNYAVQGHAWTEKNRAKYVRSKYEKTSAMNRYKQQRIKENGGRVNMEDEYRMSVDISASRAGSDKRRNDPKNDYVAETDHRIPLKTIFGQLQSNSGLTDEDIKRIANSDENFAVTARFINNPKREMSNSEFIAKQDELKARGEPYIELSMEQRENMIRMEREAQRHINDSVNNLVLKNLSGRGLADRKDVKDAIDKRQNELGRKVTAQERKAIVEDCARKKTKKIYDNAMHSAGSQSLMYALGNAALLVVKPLYYELEDGFTNGFVSGVYAGSMKEALSVRFARILDYVWEQLRSIKTYIGGAMDFLKTFISGIIETLLNMFVGLFKQILKVAKEGVKIVMQVGPVLFGDRAKTMTAKEKGDAIMKIIGGSIVAMCGIAIDTMTLGKIPEDMQGVVKAFLTGLSGVIVFYAIDKADLFSVKAERRHQRIEEVFDLRIKDIKEKTAALTESVTASLMEHSLREAELFGAIEYALDNEDYSSFTDEVGRLYQYLFGKPIMEYQSGMKWDL